MTDVRLADSLAFNCGPIIMDAVRDSDVLEIMLNPDGKIWIEKYGKDQECVGELPIAQSKVLLSLVASALDLVVDAQHPVVEGSFPLDGSRFEGTFPPIVGPGASFSMRKKASKIITLQEYLASGAITEEVIPILDAAILGRKNIVPYGLYRMEGYISANLARRVTGFTEEDLELLWEAIINMFENDHSAARGKMAVRELIVFKHSRELGDCPAYKLFDAVEIKKDDTVEYPRRYQDYSVTINKKAIPESVEVMRMV